MEAETQQNNVQGLWSGMNKIISFKVRGVGVGGFIMKARKDELNMFFNRSLCKERSAFSSSSPSQSLQPTCHMHTSLLQTLI